jgi:Flp pilus assembly protein TadD
MAVLPALIIAGCFGLPKHAEPSTGEVDVESRDDLALAANCLEQGNSAGAIGHLSNHVRRYPDHVAIRTLLAEQYFKLGMARDACSHLERILEDGQADPARHRELRITCHTRLMQMAQDEPNEFAESYHRGMGLLLVVEGWEEEHGVDRVLVERTLTQALTSFRTALESRPDDARLNLAVGDVLTRLGQPSAARTAYRKANAAPPSSFTDTERMRLARIEE